LLKPRGLSKKDILPLCQADWTAHGTPLFIIRKTGVGKSFLGGVITHELCPRGIPVRYLRTHEWLIDLKTVLQKSRLSQTVAGLRKVPLLSF
jgi:DNA replication protein DnaC